MADSAIEVTGKSVDDAIAEGLAKLGLPQSQVEVEVLSRGSRGIFGLGSEPARVRLTPRRPGKTEQAPARPESPPESLPDSRPDSSPASRPAPAPVAPPPAPTPPAREVAPLPVATPPAERRAPRIGDMEEEDAPDKSAASDAPATVVSDAELESMAVELLDELIRRMGFTAQINAAWNEPDQPDGERYLLLDIHGSDLSPLIGRRGETLAGIQYLVRLMVNQRLKSWKNVVVDVDHYKERRVAQLTQLAQRMADQVAESGRAVSLEPMPANERRIVHLALRDHAAVYTQSSGEGERRKVHIVAKT